MPEGRPKDPAWMSTINLGAGTTLTKEEPEIIEVAPSLHRGPEETRVRIVQRLTLTMEATIVRPARYACAGCGGQPPLPDAAGAEYILRNNDGDRLVFPTDDDGDEDRDRYPVTGWKRFPPLKGVYCPTCRSRLCAAVAGAAAGLVKDPG